MKLCGHTWVTSLQIKKLYKVPDFPSKRLPSWRTRNLEQRRQGLEAYIQVCAGHTWVPASDCKGITLQCLYPGAGAKSGACIQALGEGPYSGASSQQ